MRHSYRLWDDYHKYGRFSPKKIWTSHLSFSPYKQYQNDLIGLQSAYSSSLQQCLEKTSHTNMLFSLFTQYCLLHLKDGTTVLTFPQKLWLRLVKELRWHHGIVGHLVFFHVFEYTVISYLFNDVLAQRFPHKTGEFTDRLLEILFQIKTKGTMHAKRTYLPVRKTRIPCHVKIQE